MGSRWDGMEMEGEFLIRVVTMFMFVWGMLWILKLECVLENLLFGNGEKYKVF